MDMEPIPARRGPSPGPRAPPRSGCGKRNSGTCWTGTCCRWRRPTRRPPLVYTAQVQLAGEINTRNLAGSHGDTCTAALLGHALTISAPDARARVHAATAVRPQRQATGFGDTEPALPLLAAAMAAGTIGTEQTRIIVTTMRKLPAKVDPDTRTLVQKTLVDNAVITAPTPFAAFAPGHRPA